jgi:hypothetical protein
MEAILIASAVIGGGCMALVSDAPSRLMERGETVVGDGS